MARLGQNPLKWISENDRVEDVTVITIVHIPELSGFWKNSLDVLKVCFNSLIENTKESFDLIVWDNGSCKEVKDFLKNFHEAGKIQSLIFSGYNLRKIGALNHLLNIAPGKYISYADSDVFFKRNWLTESLKILNDFPETGMVSGIPTIDKMKEFYESTFKGIEKASNLIVDKGDNLIPKQYIDAHRLSIGKTKKEYFNSIENRLDIRITRNGLSAFVSAQDFQFTTTKDVIKKILPLDNFSKDLYYDPIYSPVFESKINDLGYWRLSTSKYLIHHIGNNLDKLNEELELTSQGRYKLKSNHSETVPEKRSKMKIRLYRHPLVRRSLKSIYSKIYKLLYEI